MLRKQHRRIRRSSIVLSAILGAQLTDANPQEPDKSANVACSGLCYESSVDDFPFNGDSADDVEDSPLESFSLLQTILRRQRQSVYDSVTEVSASGHPRASGAISGDTPSPGSPERPDILSQAFVQLFEWSWDDVAKECEDWLGPKGFNAVLVSPPNEHIVGDGWWTRYQPVSYNLTSRSGNETQFVNMVQRCRSVGVGIYVDAVFNHCASMSGTGVAGSKFGNRTYPLFGPKDFHHSPGNESLNCGVNDYQNQHNVQYCDLQGMPDLCSGCPRVQNIVASYINHMASLGIAGYRIDAAKHIDPNELAALVSNVNSSLFMFQEVTASPGEVVQAPMYYKNGPVTEFGYSSTVARKFQTTGQVRDDLAKVGEAWLLAPSQRAIVFADNHDTQRSGAAPLTYKSGALYDLFNIFMLAFPYGYPKVMSSYYFTTGKEGPPVTPVHGQDGSVHCGTGHPWVCEHRRLSIANMVAWRKVAGDSDMRTWSSGGDSLSFCRGRVACVAFNFRASHWHGTLSLSLAEGDYCDVLRAENAVCPFTIHVDEDGLAEVIMPPFSALAFHVADAVEEEKDNVPLE